MLWVVPIAAGCEAHSNDQSGSDEAAGAMRAGPNEDDACCVGGADDSHDRAYTPPSGHRCPSATVVGDGGAWMVVPSNHQDCSGDNNDLLFISASDGARAEPTLAAPDRPGGVEREQAVEFGFTATVRPAECARRRCPARRAALSPPWPPPRAPLVGAARR